ncbi:MAG: hypothetical protein IJ464_04765 [Alistipes sp.]|nr:hypothetical protein [Alistipes sp.]
MKNLFKSMMLVAVAAMAFTACQKDNGELNEVKRTVEFTATIGEDTRSGFNGATTDAEGKTYYQSKWDGEEMLIFLAESTSSYPVVDANGKFSVTLNENDHYADIYSPAGGWEYNYISGVGYGYYPIVPETQTPRTNSVDPAAHILSAIDVPVDGSENVSFTFKHAVAYGKMTVKTPAEFEITKVVLNLKGINQYEEDDDLTYTINATNVENNEFWFATEPLKVSEFTITAHDSDGKLMAKTVTVSEGKLLFQTGRVSTFSVSNLEEEEYVAPAFTYASADGTSGDTTVTFTSAELGTLKLNTYHCFSNSTWPIGSYTFGTSYGNIYEGSWSTYADTYLYHGEVVVSVKNGVYHIEFNNLSDHNYNVVLERATYTGHISPLDVPDSRTKLDMPNVTSSISGKSITLSWDKVDNAESYLIESYFMDPISTTETTVTVDVPNYDTREFTVQAVVSEDNTNYRSSDNAYVYYNDPRTQLAAPSNIVAIVDGPSVTISWDPVDNAAKYELNYDLNGDQTVTTEEASYTFEAGYNVSNLWVYVVALAAENNEEYRSSVEASVEVNTGKDPNVLADYTFDTLSWNSTYSRFELTGGGNGITQFYLNSADMGTDHNWIKPGDYTYAGNTVANTAQGAFSLRFLLGSGAGSSHGVNDASMNVSFADGEYKIIITIISAVNRNVVGKTFGYKGLPEGWVAPADSGTTTLAKVE